ARQNKNVRALAANSEAAAAVYERSMARIKKGALMVGIAVVGLLGMAKVTKTFGEFQYVLASAGAVMHATAGEMRTLERAAIDAGIATQFSPREAAEGLQALGAAGLNVAKSVEVLNPVLDLAAASMGQLGVAGAAENVVGVLNAFSMQADQAGMVADKLTRISQLTNFQFRDFGVAISQAAAQGYSANQTFDSMIATLGMLRNTNLHASAAATSYREAVRRLSGDKRVHRKLSKLGIEVLDKETNKIRDLGAIMADLAPRLEKMNAKEKMVTATRIFGVRGMKVYSAFVAQYNKLVKEGTVMTGDWAGAHTRLVSELGHAEGAAKKNRDALLKTAEGQRLLLKGSWETTQIMMGKLALPVVLPALKALTSVLNVVIKLIDKIPKPMRSLIANFLGVGLAIKGVVGAFKMLHGIGSIALLSRTAAATADLGGAAGGAATKTGRLAAVTGPGACWCGVGDWALPAEHWNRGRWRDGSVLLRTAAG
ncbi:MAG: phage tail tape measure protein, partial [Planctomycetota bacterium]